MSDWQINLVCCTEVICNELAHKEVTQADVAVSYAMAIKSQMQNADSPNWQIINQAILARWKMSGLERIKKRAYDILTGKVDPASPMRAMRDAAHV